MATTREGEMKPSKFWKQTTTPYKGADTRRSITQLSITIISFLLLWAAMYWGMKISYFLSLALAVPAGAFIVRLFMIQHDCGHGSYFPSRVARETVGFCLGVLTLTPFKYWASTHLYHHSHSGDLDFRELGEIHTLTVREYRNRTRWGRLRYWIYRNPFVLLVVGPAFHFLVKHRFPWDVPRKWRRAWRSVWLTNLALVAVVYVMGETLGYGRFFMLQGPTTLVACSIGVWLFYVQHQFENTYWHYHKEWDYFDAALHGSSHLVLPKPLQWLTAHIGVHHVHHLNSQIPNYRLQSCMEDNPELQVATRITIRDSWRLLWLTLWDEENQQLISFRDLRKMAPSQ